MNEIILHPSRNFLDARNPSSPFAAMLSSCFAIWQYIDDKVWFYIDFFGIKIVCIRVNGKIYEAWNKRKLFNKIKHHWGL